MAFLTLRVLLEIQSRLFVRNSTTASLEEIMCSNNQTFFYKQINLDLVELGGIRVIYLTFIKVLYFSGYLILPLLIEACIRESYCASHTFVLMFKMWILNSSPAN